MAVLLSACSPGQVEVHAVDASPHVALTTGGIWSTLAVQLRKRSIASPDGRFILAWSDKGVVVSGACSGVLSPAIVNYPPPEVVWSSNNDRFAISWSDGGAVGVWRVEAYDLSGSEPRNLQVADVMGPAPYAVYDTGNRPNNVAAVAWLDDDALLVASESPRRRTGKNDKKPEGILLSFSEGRISGTMGGETLLKNWRDYLGPRIVAAAPGE